MLVRCHNCHRKFESPTLACEACGLDPAKDPRDRELVEALVVVHFDPPTRIQGRGLNHAACDPKLRVGAVRVTSAPAAVNCAACIASDAFKASGGADNGINPAVLTKRR